VTVTVVVAVAEPIAFVAVRVYVVVAPGVTATELPVTEPGAGSMLNVSAPETVQLSVVLCAGCTVNGDAVKLAIAGDAGAPAPPPTKPNWSAGSPLPIAPILPPAPSCGSPAPISGLPGAGVYMER